MGDVLQEKQKKKKKVSAQEIQEPDQGGKDGMVSVPPKGETEQPDLD